MGLDTYASRSHEEIELTEEDIQAFLDANISLCGGIFSGDEGSFRGKVYVALVFEITGESLFAEWLPPETVRKMYKSLLEFASKEVVEQHTDLRAVEELLELLKFFKVCNDRGLGLLGWS